MGLSGRHLRNFLTYMVDKVQWWSQKSVIWGRFPCLQAAGGRSGIEGPSLSTLQRTLFGLGYVGLPYLWGRLQRAATQVEWNERM